MRAYAAAVILTLLVAGCIVRANYYPVYPDEDIPPRQTVPGEIPVYQSTEVIGRDYYVVGLVETHGNAYAKWGSHKRKLQEVAREHNGDAVIVFSSESELITIYNYANVGGYGSNIYGYGGSIPIRGLTTGAAIIRFTGLDRHEGIVPPATRAVMHAFEVDEESIARLDVATMEWSVQDSTTWLAGSPTAQFEYKPGDTVDLQLCRVAGLSGLNTLMSFYQREVLKQPDKAEVVYRCGRYQGRAAFTTTGGIELFIVDEYGSVAWQGRFGQSQ